MSSNYHSNRIFLIFIFSCFNAYRLKINLMDFTFLILYKYFTSLYLIFYIHIFIIGFHGMHRWFNYYRLFNKSDPRLFSFVFVVSFSFITFVFELSLAFISFICRCEKINLPKNAPKILNF